jgi:hypothetical protein
VVNHDGRAGQDWRPQEGRTMSESVYSPGLGKYVEVEPFHGSHTKTNKTKKQTSKDKDFIHADMKDVVLGCNVASIVWLRLLQLKTIRKQTSLVLANDWFEKHGVDRWAKNRALRTLEQSGLIKVTRSDHRSPRVSFVKTPRRTTK